MEWRDWDLVERVLMESDLVLYVLGLPTDPGV